MVRAILVTLLLASVALPARADAERVLRIEKSARRMSFEVDGRVVRRFRVALGGAPEGDKEREGDQRTPEGEFYVSTKNAASRFHRFLGLSYPMPRHAERAVAEGRVTARQARAIAEAVRRGVAPPQTTPLGGYVGIHGGGFTSFDWTLGCIAVTDEEIEWLFARVRTGDRIVVSP